MTLHELDAGGTTEEPPQVLHLQCDADADAPADLVLRSSDSVDFFVSGTLIRRLSAVFKGMFPLPPDHEVKNRMPIVRVEESSEELHCLLSIIHHDLDELDMKDCQLYIKVVQAARKYRMTAIERRLRKQAANSPLTQERSSSSLYHRCSTRLGGASKDSSVKYVLSATGQAGIR
ncbi:hypothetical protein M378DRAFT_769675 [Amanita muscaria Koide BX008]|uniref:BTB domain-containing protein n=1 Tax=Amanita muscaria (strain Koide BX008) TaxID=946122 RepID=A0A0C2XI94_AMAMK|nr:hypothetical protein M378DRAFT_769675 [Amanita muscaria Koide BX008]